ncbi:unnamed protein product [Spirodela intermedia]|uniref:Uncharacterized protein n=1 Tax=Spirodela intermedia TaxID=51605 RepID=A0A7I8IY54_SPIIN|nr:unnamed protein product [Spirodela intermedia]CAA6662739.1 unnamed protein product [Spirodela intermedia]
MDRVDPPESLFAEGLKLQQAIVLRLLEEVSCRKASKELGYFVAVTSLESVGEGQLQELTGNVIFPSPSGARHPQGAPHGIMLAAGPLEGVFLSAKAMGDGYEYLPRDEPVFLSEKLSRLESGGAVRFKVLGLKWMEEDREFQVLATMAADFLGPLISDDD